MESVKQRPYFIWNADLTEEDVRRILIEGSAYSRTQLMGTLLQYARFSNIWKYISVRDVQNGSGRFRGATPICGTTGNGR